MILRIGWHLLWLLNLGNFGGLQRFWIISRIVIFCGRLHMFGGRDYKLL